MRLFVANVGVNSNDARKRGLRSPVLPDGSFEFVPIKESSTFRAAANVPFYRELPSWTGRWSSLGEVVPERALRYRVHNDPDFLGLTYGEIERSRASALARVQPGDQLWFLARLWDHDGERFTGGNCFYFVGRFEVELNLRLEPLKPDVDQSILSRLEGNAHWKRWLAGDREPFRVLVGAPLKSARFRHPVQVTAEVARLLFAAEAYDDARDRFARGGVDLLNLNGRPRTMRHFHSITRTIQAYLDTNRDWQQPYVQALHDLAMRAGAAVPPP